MTQTSNVAILPNVGFVDIYPCTQIMGKSETIQENHPVTQQYALVDQRKGLSLILDRLPNEISQSLVQNPIPTPDTLNSLAQHLFSDEYKRQAAHIRPTLDMNDFKPFSEFNPNSRESFNSPDSWNDNAVGY